MACHSSSHRHRRYRRSDDVPKCTWRSGGYRCVLDCQVIALNGVKAYCTYCEYHQCKRQENGGPCPTPTISGWPYCRTHMRCNGMTDSGRCNNEVKSRDPDKYQFCAQLHNCLMEDCDGQRPHSEEAGKYCTEHTCSDTTCKSSRIDDSTFCIRHTCEFWNCSALAREGGEPGTRFCDRHKQCKLDTCARPVHFRESMQASPYCGLHYCTKGECDNERQTGAEFCRDHVCVEQGCSKGRNGPDSLYCKSHQCKTAGCQHKRRRADWCVEHLCVKPGCDQEGGENRYCTLHQFCIMPACGRFRAIIDDQVMRYCEEHEKRDCNADNCDAKVTGDLPYCDAHLCSIRPCKNVVAENMKLCQHHKCDVINCPAPKWEMGIPIRGIFAPTVLAAGQYCSSHTCHEGSCRQFALDKTSFCARHNLCRRDGCKRSVDQMENGEYSSYCREHNQEGQHGRRNGPMLGFGGDQWANWGVAI